MREHQELHDEFDVDHAAAIVLDVKQRGRIRMTVEHSRTHFKYVGAEFLRVAMLHQNPTPLGLEALADL